MAALVDDTASNSNRPHPLLEPINLHSEAQFDELLHQRKICGWDNTPEVLLAWRSQIDRGLQYFFWIILPFSPSSPSSKETIHAGHISVAHKSNPYHHLTPNSESTPADQVQHVKSLFILPEFRASGLGRRAMAAIEAIARLPPYGSPEIKALTLNCLHKRYADDNSSEEWRPFAEKLYAKLGLPMPDPGKSNQDWYERMGFRVLGEEPNIPTGEFREDGSEIFWLAVGMRKDLAED
ncbi:hypothetical protein V8F20_001405 [Naviculisporaceae sp. PSN 640]